MEHVGLMDDMHGLTRTTVIGLKGLFVGLAAISVALRLIANWKYNRKLLVDDYISITAIPFLIAVAILSDAAGNGFHDPSLPPYKVAQLAVAIAVFTPLALFTCKAPILFLYIRLFGIKKWLRVTSYATLALMALVYVSGIVAIPPACAPHARDLSDAFVRGCQARTRTINVYLGSVSVLADVVILVLPMPVVFGLKLLIRSRVGLVFLFLSGLFAIGASIISLFFKAVSLQSPATSLALSILATITECSVALIVGCVPSLRVLWSKILKPSVKSTRGDYYVTTNVTNRAAASSSQYMIVGEGTDRKTSQPEAKITTTALSASFAPVVSTEVYTTSTTIAEYNNPQLQQQQVGLRGEPYDGRPFYGQPQQTYLRPDAGQLGDGGIVEPPFGVYAEAYALQTRHQGVWGR